MIPQDSRLDENVNVIQTIMILILHKHAHQLSINNNATTLVKLVSLQIIIIVEHVQIIHLEHLMHTILVYVIHNTWMLARQFVS